MPCYQATGAAHTPNVVVVLDTSLSMASEIPHIKRSLIKRLHALNIRECITFSNKCQLERIENVYSGGGTFMDGVPKILGPQMTAGCTVVIITDGELSDSSQTRSAFDNMVIDLPYSIVFIQITSNEVVCSELATFIKNATTVNTIRILPKSVQTEFDSTFSSNIETVNINVMGTTSLFIAHDIIQSIPDGTIFYSDTQDLNFPVARTSEITQFVDNSVRRALLGGMSFASVSQVVNDFAKQYSEKVATQIRNVLAQVAKECGNTQRIHEYLARHGSSFLANGQRKIVKRALGNTTLDMLRSPLRPNITHPDQRGCITTLRTAQDLIEDIQEPIPENYKDVFQQVTLFGIALNRQSQTPIGQNPWNIVLMGGVSCLPQYQTSLGFTHQGDEYPLQFPLQFMNEFVGSTQFVRGVQDLAAANILYNDPAIIIPKSRSAVLFAILVDIISHHDYRTDFMDNLITKLKIELRSNIGQTSIAAVMNTDVWVNGTEQLHPLEVLAILTCMNADSDKFNAWLRYQILRSSKSDTNIITFPNMPDVYYDTDYTQVPMSQPTYADYYHVHSQNRRSIIDVFTLCTQYVGVVIENVSDLVQSLYRQQSHSSVDEHTKIVYDRLLKDAIVLARVNRSNAMLQCLLANDVYDLTSVTFTYEMAKSAVQHAIQINNFDLFRVVTGLTPVPGFTTRFTSAHFRSYKDFIAQHDMEIYDRHCLVYKYREMGNGIHSNEFPSYFIYNCYNMTEFIAYCHDKPDILAKYRVAHQKCTCIKENPDSTLSPRAKIRIGIM